MCITITIVNLMLQKLHILLNSVTIISEPKS